MLAKAPMDRRIAEIITPTVEGMGFELVRVRLMAGRKITLQIMAERPDGSMEIEDCAALSRALSAVLDVEDPIEREYSLEVSSPGIDRPLTRLAHFDAHKGFLAKLETEELIGGRKRFKGELLGVDGDSVLIEADEAGRVALPFEALADARLVLTDELVAASLRRRKTEFNEAAFDHVDVEDGEPDEPSGEEPEERENA